MLPTLHCSDIECALGSKCKFSHDLNVERKAEKMNIYEDTRDKEKDKREGMVILVSGELSLRCAIQTSWKIGTKRSYGMSLRKIRRSNGPQRT